MNGALRQPTLFFTCLLFYYSSYAQELSDLDTLNGQSFSDYYGYPIPERTDQRLFYIQRNISKNVVVYDSNLNEEHELDQKRPYKMYWKRYNENLGGKEFDLTWLERTMGYRLKVLESAATECKVSLISYKKRKFKIVKTPSGKVEARIDIKGRPAIMWYIFMHMEDSFWPDVHFLEIGGQDLETGEYIFEQFLP